MSLISAAYSVAHAVRTPFRPFYRRTLNPAERELIDDRVTRNEKDIFGRQWTVSYRKTVTGRSLISRTLKPRNITVTETFDDNYLVRKRIRFRNMFAEPHNRLLSYNGRFSIGRRISPPEPVKSDI